MDRIPDNYDYYKKFAEEQDKQLLKLPKCSYCDEHIQTEELCDIDGTLYCMECFKDNFIKNVEDYIG
jgi:formylmethanofuran dehydrogenase subunit E